MIKSNEHQQLWHPGIESKETSPILDVALDMFNQRTSIGGLYINGKLESEKNGIGCGTKGLRYSPGKMEVFGWDHYDPYIVELLKNGTARSEGLLLTGSPDELIYFEMKKFFDPRIFANEYNLLHARRTDNGLQEFCVESSTQKLGIELPKGYLQYVGLSNDFTVEATFRVNDRLELTEYEQVNPLEPESSMIIEFKYDLNKSTLLGIE